MILIVISDSEIKVETDFIISHFDTFKWKYQVY